jgi:hypothetical protein
MHGQWLILIVYRLEMSIVRNCYKMQSMWMNGTKPLTNCVEYILSRGSTVLDI